MSNFEFGFAQCDITPAIGVPLCGYFNPRPNKGAFDRLAVKLQWNTISTGTMVCLGRVSGNWMSYVAISNKKLIDRAIRLISELGNVDYHTACVELFRTIAEPDGTPAVRQTLTRLAASK